MLNYFIEFLIACELFGSFIKIKEYPMVVFFLKKSQNSESISVQNGSRGM